MTGWPPEALPRLSAEPQRLRNDLDTFGYCLIASALDAATLEAARERLEEQAQAEREAAVDFKNPGHLDNQWVNMLINKGEVFERLALHPLATAVVEHMLGPEYLLSCCDAQIKNPGADFMPLHTDQWWMPPPAPVGGGHVRPAAMRRGREGALDPSPSAGPAIPALGVTVVMWMLTDFTSENGATVVVPGSHRSGCQPDGSVPHKVQTVAAIGPAGSAIVFEGRLWHAAGANRTAAPRCGITCTYCGPQFRPLENYTLGLRPEVKARASTELLRRLGFKAWSTYGHTGDPDLDVSASGHETLGEMRPRGV